MAFWSIRDREQPSIVGTGPRVRHAGILAAYNRAKSARACCVSSRKRSTHCVERSVARASELLAAGKYAETASALEAALGEWRGQPLSDFTHDAFAARDIQRLLDLHAEGEEQLATARLALGDASATLTGMLEQLVPATRAYIARRVAEGKSERRPSAASSASSHAASGGSSSTPTTTTPERRREIRPDPDQQSAGVKGGRRPAQRTLDAGRVGRVASHHELSPGRRPGLLGLCSQGAGTLVQPSARREPNHCLTVQRSITGPWSCGAPANLVIVPDSTSRRPLKPVDGSLIVGSPGASAWTISPGATARSARNRGWRRRCDLPAWRPQPRSRRKLSGSALGPP
jgi:hypothetical protein